MCFHCEEHIKSVCHTTIRCVDRQEVRIRTSPEKRLSYQLRTSMTGIVTPTGRAFSYPPFDPSVVIRSSIRGPDAPTWAVCRKSVGRPIMDRSIRVRGDWRTFLLLPLLVLLFTPSGAMQLRKQLRKHSLLRTERFQLVMLYEGMAHRVSQDSKYDAG